MNSKTTDRSLLCRLTEVAVFLVVAVSFGTALIISRLCRTVRRDRWLPNSCIALTGTFFSRNWYRAHAVPLARSGRREVYVVTDEPLDDIEGVHFVCPPRWAARLLGRALSKTIWMIGVGLRHQPDLYMGYYIFPNALLALIVGRLFGRPTCYQMTGGPIEIRGGGFETENRVQGRLGRPSPYLERLGRNVVREFDLVVVRGGHARRFVSGLGLNGRVEIIPGSLEANVYASRPCAESGSTRCHDLVWVGRMTEMKQPLQFIDIVAGVRRELPGVRAVMIGEGPLMPSVRERVKRLDLQANVRLLGKIEGVASVLVRSRVFVMTSSSEGLSIAMAEAMAAGAVPVASDVGELGDLVRDGETGFLIPPDDVDNYVRQINVLLTDTPVWQRLSAAAAQAARDYNDVSVVAERWRVSLEQVIAAHRRRVRG